ncbi:MAG TPA: amidase family protein [Bacilli bacterium]|nr:amidase family protein [Bacilli bacterium]
MNNLNMRIKDIHEALLNKKISSLGLVNESLDKINKYQDIYNIFVTVNKDFEEKEITNILSGIPYAAKDNFSTKGILTTASSNILKNYVPIFDATCIEKLKNSNAILIGKTVLDELAMGGTGTTAATGIVRNPWDKNRYIGGSSAGSAAAVALGIVPFALGSDTGDSVRKPAGYAGIVGFKPTYGLISRYGLFAFASSLDHVGCFTNYVEDIPYVIDTIKGKDEKDMTSLDTNISFVDEINKELKYKKVFYIKEIVDVLKSNTEYYNNFVKIIDYVKSIGIEVVEESIDINILNGLYPSYMSISCAEATSNNSNLTGIVFGNRKEGKTFDEVMFSTRTEGFGELIKRRFILGSYILQKENQEKLFINAKRIRRLIVDKINDLFKTYDAFIMPNSSSEAPLFTEEIDRLSSKYLLLENHLVIANFGGFPSITIPSGMINNMPVAINITGRAKEDIEVIKLAKILEDKISFRRYTDV